jgi:hypothetical protein
MEISNNNESQNKIAANEIKDISRIVKLCTCGFLLIGLSFWLSAQAASSSRLISTTVKQFLAVFIVAFGVFISVTMRRFFDVVKKQVGQNQFLQMMVGVLKSDWIKAFALLACPYAIPFYAFITYLNQCIRKFRGIDDQKNYAGITLLESNYFTKNASRQFSELLKLNWTTIVTKAYIMGILLFILNVAAEKSIYLMLIYIGEAFEGISLDPWPKAFLVLALWYITGLCGFMLPPVPGPPLYLFGGVVVTKSFMATSPVGDDTGYWTGIIVTMCASLCLKLNACSFEQKLIGEGLSSSNWVLTTVGVHTAFIRGVEKILGEKGISMGKVAILCGGPDWPTSVLCGLLKLDLLPIMVGTLPIIFLIAPTVLTGAFSLKDDDEYKMIAATLLMVTLVICMGLGVWAGYAVQCVLDKHPNLLTIPLLKNKELDWIDYKESVKMDKYLVLCNWKSLPTSLQGLLIFGLLVMNYSMFLFTWYDTQCFGSFTILNKSSDFGVKSDQIRLIEPLGYVSLGFFFGAYFIYKIANYFLDSISEEELKLLDEKFEKPEEKQKWEGQLSARILACENLMKEFQPEDYLYYLNNNKKIECTGIELTPV